MVGVRTNEQRDRRGADHLRRSARQSRPSDLASQTECVEPNRLVPLEPGRQHVAFPGARRQIQAIELRDHRTQAFDAVEAARRLDMLPPEKEAHELGRAHRRDLGPQTVQRVAVDACEQSSVAPLEDMGRFTIPDP